MTGVQRVDALAQVPMDDIHPSPDNVRERVGDVTELAASIKAQGLLQPIVVARDLDTDGYVILAGHRRYAALQRLGYKTALCVIRQPRNHAEMIALMLVENGQRVPVSPLEEAKALKVLIDGGLTQYDIARRIGKSQTHVSQRLSLLALPDEEQKAVAKGDLLLRDAYQKARVAKGTDQSTKFTGWHFGKTHPLATAAGELCRSHNNEPPHTPARRLSALACGSCWEAVIRTDERNAS